MGKTLFGVPNIVWVMLGAAAIAWVLLNKTAFGRYTFALGSNEEATRLSGVNVDRWKITVYAVKGLFVGLAGIVIASRMNSAQPGLGVGYELDAIAAAVIGGTSLSGGEGSIVGTVIGAFLTQRRTGTGGGKTHRANAQQHEPEGPEHLFPYPPRSERRRRAAKASATSAAESGSTASSTAGATACGRELIDVAGAARGRPAGRSEVTPAEHALVRGDEGE